GTPQQHGGRHRRHRYEDGEPLAARRRRPAPAARHRRGLRVVGGRPRAGGGGVLAAQQGAGVAALHRDDRDDLHRQLHRRPHPGQARPPGRRARGRCHLRRRHPAGLADERVGRPLAADPRVRRGQRLRPRLRLHRPDRHAAEVVPGQEGAHHGPGRRRVRLRRGDHGPRRPGADRPQRRRPHQRVPAAGAGLPRRGAGRGVGLPQPARRLHRPRPHTAGRRGGRWGQLGLHAGRGAAHAAVVPPDRDPRTQRQRGDLPDLPGQGQRRRHRRLQRHRGRRAGRHPGDLQRRRPRRVGRHLRQDRPDAHVRRHPAAAGALPHRAAARRERRAVHGPRRGDLPLLRRHVRHDARDRRRLLRPQERRRDLRPDARRVEPRRHPRPGARLGAHRRGQGLHRRLHDRRGHRRRRGGADLHHEAADARAGRRWPGARV
ncbi:MAG: hypothetical protein AVDCRST_MAG32-1465, partial [uncultured Nocardioides sp.]